MNLEGRKVVFIVFFLAVGILFSLRLFYMQVVDDRWVERSAEVAQRKIIIKPPRGVMYDRNGEKVVSNKTYYNLMFVENQIKDLDTNAFAEILGMSIEEIHERFEEIKKSFDRKTRSKKTGRDTLVNDYRSYLPYAFLSELSAEEIASIAIDLPSFKGFYEEPISMRHYPFPYASNIFGYLNEISAVELAKDRKFYQMGDNIGRSGLERYYEKQLRGQKGVKYILSSARGNIVDNFAGGRLDTPSVQSPPLQLGIDIHLQGYGEKLMENKRGSIVVIEPKTGEILTMVNAPTYNPNLLVGKRNIQKHYNRLSRDSLRPLYPRPLQAEYPPGSIFKVVQSLVGLQEGVVAENTGFICNKALVGCHNHPNAKSIQQAIQFSCNPYFYYLVKRIIQQGENESIYRDAAIGLEKWEKYMHSFGFGKPPKIDVYGVRSGVIPNVAFYDRWYGEYRWAFSTIRSISIGQGEVKMTPLQMANLAVVVANKGFYYEPHIVKNIGDEGPDSIYLEKNQTLVEENYFDLITEGMVKVVNEDRGTARRARISDITVAGKTGTAQNPHGEDHSVFIAFAPAENPKIAIAVFVENAGFGGTWAAPIASLMIERYLKGTIENKRKEDRILEASF